MFDILCQLDLQKEDGKDYSFDFFYGLLIRAYEKLLDEGKLEVKQQANLMKGYI